jgi:polyhydroxybutyrate depolymerase
MQLRRPLLLVGGAALCLVAGFQAVPSATPVPAEEARASAPVLAAPARDVVQPGSTGSVATSTSYRGTRRSFVLHVPDGLLGPAPLVVALHAHSQGPSSIRAYSRLEAFADENGFVVAFPGGAGGSWNAGTCCAPGAGDGVDDVAFLDEVIALSRERAEIDPQRIAVVGASNGGMMALRYGCARPDLLASVVVVSSPLIAPCPGAGATPVLALHGAQDAEVPLEGGSNARLGVTFPPIAQSLEPFRRAGAEVQVQVVPRAAHIWMTRTQHGFDATAAMWSWMRDRPRTS